MTQKLMKSGKKIVGPKRKIDCLDGEAITLVGTYKENQLAWIKKHGIYNYPVKDEDELKPESCAKVKELWLYASAKGKRYCFAAEFVGIQTKDEFLAANPTYKNLGPSKHTRYMVFKTSVLDYGPRLEGTVILRNKKRTLKYQTSLTLFAQVSHAWRHEEGVTDYE